MTRRTRTSSSRTTRRARLLPPACRHSTSLPIFRTIRISTDQASPPSHTASPTTLQFVPNVGSSSNYAVAWNDTVTAAGNTYDQVEFSIYSQSGSQVGTASTFQIADGNAQDIELTTATIGGTSVEILVYGDDTGTNVVEFRISTL